MKKVAVITGANQGIGKNIADILLENNYIVVNASRKKPATNSEAVFIKTDVTKREDCKKLVQAVVKKFGKIDVFVNNAGVMYPDSIENIDFEKARIQFETNVFGMLYCSFLAAKQMIKQKNGQIVNIASSAGISFREGLLSYAASKWSVVGLTGALRCDLQKHGVDVICFCPGGTKTRLFRHYKEDPSKEYMEPKELAGKIVESMNRFSREKWLFVYLRKDRILRQYGFDEYPAH